MRYHLRNWVAASIAVLALAVLAFAQAPGPATGVFVAAPSTTSCTTTVSSGAALITAVGTNLSTAKTICVTAGSYGTVNLFNITRTALATIAPASGAMVTMSPQVGNTDFVRFDGSNGTFTFTNTLVNSCSVTIEFADVTWAPNAAALYLDASDCPSTTHNYLVDNNIFDSNETSGFEGRLSLRSANGVIIRNSTFSGIAAAESSDGIFLGGDSTNVTIGPGNVFADMVQEECNSVDGAHCDVIQLLGSDAVTIKQNIFRDSSTFIMAPDGSGGPTLVENNVFDGTNNGNEYKIQFGSAIGLTFRHNTMKNTSAAFDSKPGNPATQATVDNNIIYAVGSGNYGQWKTSNGSGCSGCLFRYTMSSGSPQTSLTGCSGCTIANYFQGTPTFTGGNPVPSSWAGWLLSGGSSGENAGSDGFDVGTLYYGS